jgi:hypothetical protein
VGEENLLEEIKGQERNVTSVWWVVSCWLVMWSVDGVVAQWDGGALKWPILGLKMENGFALWLWAVYGRDPASHKALGVRGLRAQWEREEGEVVRVEVGRISSW